MVDSDCFVGGLDLTSFGGSSACLNLDGLWSMELLLVVDSRFSS